jgi:hypothetical protein
VTEGDPVSAAIVKGGKVAGRGRFKPKTRKEGTMSQTASDGAAQESPTARAVRFWLGLLVVLMFCAQIGAGIWGYVDWSRARPDHLDQMRVYWHRFAVAVLSLSLAMISIVGGAGLTLSLNWAWRVIAAGSVLQILVTLGTQIWEAMLVVPDGYPPGRGLLGALIGIIAWSILPVGVLVLSIASRPPRLSA